MRRASLTFSFLKLPFSFYCNVFSARGSCLGDVVEYSNCILYNMLVGLNDPRYRTKRWMEEDDAPNKAKERKTVKKDVTKRMKGEAKLLSMGLENVQGCAFEESAILSIQRVLNELGLNGLKTK